MKYLFLVSLFTLATVANAQHPAQPQRAMIPCKDGKTPIRLLLKDSFKIKAATTVNSATARVADYVEFRTLEPIYSDEKYPSIVFDKDTPIYAVVTRRNHRHFPLVRGKLEIALDPLMTWDNKRIEMAISRHGMLTETETGVLTKKDLEDRNKRRNKPCKVNEANCVAGRGNAEVSVVVTAVAAASGAAVSAISKDDDTKFIAATSFFSVAKDLGNLLNGTDVGITKDEIFDLKLKEGSEFCKIPKPDPPKPTEAGTTNIWNERKP